MKNTTKVVVQGKCLNKLKNVHLINAFHFSAHIQAAGKSRTKRKRASTMSASVTRKPKAATFSAAVQETIATGTSAMLRTLC